MIGVDSDFMNRVAEVDAYLIFLEKIDAESILLMRRDQGMPVDGMPIQNGKFVNAYSATEQSDLTRTLKASAFLLLYNLMESTVSNAVEAIFDEFESRGVSFDNCRLAVRKVVLGNLRQHDLAKILPELKSISIDMITKTFRKEKIVSGNVDARRIREVAEEYGFAHPSSDGGSLLTVKTSRNDLAHGSKSFSEVGRDYTVSQIISMKEKIILYLKEMLANVTSYINQQHYLAGPGRL